MGWSHWILSCSCAAVLPAQRAEPRPLPDDPTFRAERAVRLLELPSRCSDAWLELLRLQQAAALPLAAALSDPRPEVVTRAAFILGQLGEAAQAAAPRLRQGAAAADAATARACRWALQRIEHRQTVLVDYMGGVELLGADGKVERTYKVQNPWHAQPLADGHLLVSEYSQNVVSEVDAEDKMVWSFRELNGALRCQRLPDGHTVIADGGNKRVIEVDAAGKLVLEIKDLARPADAERLPDGHTLIADSEAGRVVEFDAVGKQVWEFRGCTRPMDADRLANGNTLIAAHGDNEVLEVDRAGTVVARIADLQQVQDVQRLANGHTLVAMTKAFVEFDAAGKEVWRRAGQYACRIERQ